MASVPSTDSVSSTSPSPAPPEATVTAAAAPEAVAPPPRGLWRLGSALTSRNFRLLWIANVLSTSGTWMQKVAQNWLVLTLTGSAFYLGLDNFLGDLPILLLTLVGGVIADRHDRRLLLIGSQVVQLTTAFTLAALVYFDVVRIWHVLALSAVTGVAQSFGGPAYQSLLPSLVERKDLPNAIALNSIQFNLSRILGPLVAGVALATVGMAACFGLNGLSFFFVIWALLMLRLPRTMRTAAPAGEKPSIAGEMKTGLSYVRQRPALVMLTVIGFLSTFLGLPLQTLMPVVAREVFGQGVQEYSRMMAWSGTGAVAGALIVAWRGRYAHMGRTALIVQCVFGVIVVAFAFSRVLALSYVLLFAGGAAMIVMTSTMISLAQLIAPDEMRGRVMSIYMVAFRGGMPLGALAAGTLASQTSAPLALAVNGALLTAVSIWFLTQNHGVKEL